MLGSSFLDSPFFKFAQLVADIIILNFLWIIFSVPIFTIGAATSALYFCTTRRIADREGYITQDFWKAFKVCFVKSTILWVLMLIIGIGSFLNIRAVLLGYIDAPLVFHTNIVLVVLLLLMSVFIFPVAARFDMGIKQIIKTSFFFSMRHFLTTISCLSLLLVLLFIVIYIAPFLVVFLMGTYAWFTSYLIMLIFRRYRPEIDPDPMVELMEIEARKEEEKKFLMKSGYDPDLDEGDWDDDLDDTENDEDSDKE